MLSSAISRLVSAFTPSKQTEQDEQNVLNTVEAEVLHVAMLDGKIAVILEASGESAIQSMHELLDQGVTKLIVLASSEGKKKEVLDKFHNWKGGEGHKKQSVVGIVDAYNPSKESLDTLLKRVKKAAGVPESAGMVSLFEYKSVAETYSGVGNACDFEEISITTRNSKL